eukprot:TRINITY_DN51020_c0_g1_i1.p1 TRINITY_DN51020_c0_g1~~TRINITY_DN51020_c0_g1_i1.p1  ORF type:complete len:319 (+),score=78.23 TRINITY_DN51020_c0_g1_i1:187-1143(+)
MLTMEYGFMADMPKVAAIIGTAASAYLEVEDVHRCSATDKMGVAAFHSFYCLLACDDITGLDEEDCLDENSLDARLATTESVSKRLLQAELSLQQAETTADEHKTGVTEVGHCPLHFVLNGEDEEDMFVADTFPIEDEYELVEILRPTVVRPLQEAMWDASRRKEEANLQLPMQLPKSLLEKAAQKPWKTSHNRMSIDEGVNTEDKKRMRRPCKRLWKTGNDKDSWQADESNNDGMKYSTGVVKPSMNTRQAVCLQDFMKETDKLKYSMVGEGKSPKPSHDLAHFCATLPRTPPKSTTKALRKQSRRPMLVERYGWMR